MIIVGVIFGAVTGNMKAVTEAALDSAGEAVSLCITMAGVMALWVGLMEVAEKSGLLLKLTNMTEQKAVELRELPVMRCVRF